MLGCWCASPTTPGVRLRDIATTLGPTEGRAYGIVTGLTGRDARFELSGTVAAPAQRPEHLVEIACVEHGVGGVAAEGLVEAEVCGEVALLTVASLLEAVAVPAVGTRGDASTSCTETKCWSKVRPAAATSPGTTRAAGDRRHPGASRAE
jgi:hypothetical protein